MLLYGELLFYLEMSYGKLLYGEMFLGKLLYSEMLLRRVDLWRNVIWRDVTEPIMRKHYLSNNLFGCHFSFGEVANWELSFGKNVSPIIV